MHRRIPIFYSALLLTGVNLLLRFAGTSFQVYLSGKIGPAGIGLLQLVLSVGSLAMVAGMAGIRTTAMYLTAEELGKKKPGNIIWVLSGCFRYSLTISGLVALLLWFSSPVIAQHWIRDPRCEDALRLFACFLPVSCLCGVMTGYFTAANRIGTLAAVEVAEQICSMGITLLLLHYWARSDPGRACQSVILGSSMGGCFTLLCLLFLRFLEHPVHGRRIPVAHRLKYTAAPLAVADVLKSGINTAENLMVPRRLSRNTSVVNPLASFGMVSGMVFPVMMFPACILFGLAELLIPELARCEAARNRERIRYLVHRSLHCTMLYGFAFGGLIYLLAEPLCMRLYGSAEASLHLRLYSLLIPMLYCDSIVDAMTKGLGQQKICVRYNILTSGLDVLFLFFLLPKYGMIGYFVSFMLTHLVNFLLSLRRLLSIAGEQIPFYLPVTVCSASIISILGASLLRQPIPKGGAYLALLGSSLYLLGIVRKSDLIWIRNLVYKK